MEDEVYCSSLVVDKALAREWKLRQAQTAMVELLGAVAAIDVHSEQLRSKYVTLLVDSEPVEGCLVKGYSFQEDAGDLSSVFWDLVRRFEIAVCISRISTDANPADQPSRGEFALLEKMGRRGLTLSCEVWKSMEEIILTGLVIQTRTTESMPTHIKKKQKQTVVARVRARPRLCRNVGMGVAGVASRAKLCVQ